MVELNSCDEIKFEISYFYLPVVYAPSFMGMYEQDTATMQATERISKVFMLTVNGDLVPSEESITPFILRIVEFCLQH